jgi:hypothetical protein
MLELLGKIAHFSSWTGRVDNGLIRINEKKILETKPSLLTASKISRF